MLATFSISFALVWLYALIIGRTGSARERCRIDSMFDPDLLAW
jgi:hypothetical protein